MRASLATVCAGRTRTQRESIGRMARLAGALHELDVEDGERAAILSLNSDRYQELAVLAVDRDLTTHRRHGRTGPQTATRSDERRVTVRTVLTAALRARPRIGPGAHIRPDGDRNGRPD